MDEATGVDGGNGHGTRSNRELLLRGRADRFVTDLEDSRTTLDVARFK